MCQELNCSTSYSSSTSRIPSLPGSPLARNFPASIPQRPTVGLGLSCRMGLVGPPWG
jgi:hypothetical protein